MDSRTRVARPVLLLALGRSPGLLPTARDDDSDSSTRIDEVEIVVAARSVGAPGEGRIVYVLTPDEMTSMSDGTTGTDGTIRFGSIDAGQYDLQIDLPSGMELEEEEAGVKRVTVESGETTEVSLALARMVTIVTLSASNTHIPAEVTIPLASTGR